MSESINQIRPVEDEIKGIRFYDLASSREMLLRVMPNLELWLLYKHPGGDWVYLRQATDEDLQRLRKVLEEAQKAILSLSVTLAKV
jgi:hypothetical protein